MTTARGATYGWISLTTDYGLMDGFVASVHGMIGLYAPGVRVLDVTHLISPGDVRRGSAVLAQTVEYLPVGVHVAVVDPGVGTARRAIAVATERGLLVGPDNGLLMPAAAALGGAHEAVELTNSEWLADRVSATFHGRDVFAPVAARLATGAALADAGPALDPAALRQLPAPRVVVGEGRIEAEVLTVDWFGNVQLAAPGSTLSGLGTVVQVGSRTARAAATFADADPGDLVVYVDSADHVAVAINGGQAAAVLALAPGDLVRIASR
jgi:S-adenosylmethionine hydrolase